VEVSVGKGVQEQTLLQGSPCCRAEDLARPMVSSALGALLWHYIVPLVPWEDSGRKCPAGTACSTEALKSPSTDLNFIPR